MRPHEPLTVLMLKHNGGETSLMNPIRTLTNKRMWLAEVIARVAGRVGRASLGGVRAAVVGVAVVEVLVDEALAFGGAFCGIVHDHHGGFHT